jgi:hypothetical protein
MHCDHPWDVLIWRLDNQSKHEDMVWYSFISATKFGQYNPRAMTKSIWNTLNKSFSECVVISAYSHSEIIP